MKGQTMALQYEKNTGHDTLQHFNVELLLLTETSSIIFIHLKHALVQQAEKMMLTFL